MRGHATERSPGVWRLRVDAGNDPLTGRRRQPSRTFKGTRTEADAALARFITEINDGHTGSTSTVGALLERWLTWATPNLSPYTVAGYRSKLDNQIKPALGDLPLAKLTPARLDDLYAALQGRGGVDGQPLSPASVRQCHAIIRRACEMGLRWGLLARNPAALATPPTVRTHQDDLPYPDDLVKIIETAPLELSEIAQLAVVSGARRGELCALRWDDVDLDGAELRIRHTLVLDHGQLVLRPPKSGNQRRERIDAGTVDLLRARQLRARERALACGTKLAGTAYVFTDDPAGTAPLNPVLVTGRWRNHTKRLRFHDLRHFSTTFLIDSGITARDVAERHGWASTQMLHDRYKHATRAQDEHAAELLGGLFRRRDAG